MNDIPDNLITLLDFRPDQVEKLLHKALEIKRQFKTTGPSTELQGRCAVMIFEKPSLRTRVTFEVGMIQFGGHTVDLNPNSIGLGERETVKDASLNLSRWIDLIIARTYSHNLVMEIAKYAQVPVINALTDLFHPCQALAHGLTLMEKRGSLKDLRLVFVGDGNNVANSLAVLAGLMGMHFTLACPPGYEHPRSVIDQVQPLFKSTGKSFTIMHDVKNAVSQADVIYTDVWVSMGENDKVEEKKAAFAPYQVNTELVSRAPKECLVSHCLPAHRGEEISDEVLDSSNSICFDEAENRLHAQKAVLLSLIQKSL